MLRYLGHVRTGLECSRATFPPGDRHSALREEGTPPFRRFLEEAVAAVEARSCRPAGVLGREGSPRPSEEVPPRNRGADRPGLTEELLDTSLPG
jgi:hypothetical protein